MKKILMLLFLTLPLFAQNTDKNNTFLGSDETLWRVFQKTAEVLRVTLDSASIADLTGVDTLFWGVTDTSASKVLIYGDSILSVEHTNPYLFYEIIVYDSLNGTTAAALTDSLAVEVWNSFTSTWSAISVLNENTGVRVSTLAPTSGVTRIYSVKIPYVAYGRDLRVRRTNVENIVGRSTWVTIRGIN